MKINSFLLAMSVAASFTFSACNQHDDDIDCDHYHWSYEGETGPSTWQICEAGCGGGMQSPIDLSGAVIDPAIPEPDVAWNYTAINMINNGHSIQLNHTAGSSLTLEGIAYELKQVHFHTGSEHTQDGVQHEMEVHLVHTNAAGTHNVVIGIFFNEGTENSFLSSLIPNIPTTTGGTFQSADTLNVQQLFPEDGNYYTYEGSLTTPPCSQTVTWIVLDTPSEASAAQLAVFEGLLHHNHRPVQALNGRVIKRTNL